MWKIFSVIFVLILAELVCQVSFFLVNSTEAASQAYLPRLDLIKGSGPEIYVLESGTRHWIPSIEIFNKFNFKWENVKTYSDLIIQNYPQDDDWSRYDDYPDGSLLKGSGLQVYLIELGKRRWIPSPTIFLGNNFGWKYILQIDDNDLDDYDLGENLTLSEPNRYPETTISSGPSEGEVVKSDTIEFRYAGTNPLGNNDQLDFETYLSGYDDDWDNQRSDYTQDYDVEDLGGGSFTFYVRAKNEQGYYDSTPATRSFSIGVSSYYHKIEFYSVDYDEDNFQDEYIILKNNGGQTIDVTGWTIQTKLASLDIGQAVKKLSYPYTDNSQVNIELRDDDKLVITAGASPIGVDFQTNKCTGYLDQGDFSPSLDNNCPRVDSSEYSGFNQYCQNFISGLSKCELPDYSSNTDVGGDSQCTSYLNQNLNYSACYSNYRLDPDFYEDEWHIFMGRTSHDILSDDSDTIILYDQNGLKVDEYYYD